jgi:hypothetical protein
VKLAFDYSESSELIAYGWMHRCLIAQIKVGHKPAEGTDHMSVLDTIVSYLAKEGGVQL